MEYLLKLKQGEVPLYFGTWSLSRFCELNGNLSFSQMQELFSKDIAFKHIISLFLCGAEHYARKNKQPFDFSDVDASDWIDEIGGAASEEFSKVMTMIAYVINPQYQGIDVKKGKEEKKRTSVGLSSGSNVSGPESGQKKLMTKN
jgi:hypothetical protein